MKWADTNHLPKWQPLHYVPDGAESLLDVGCNYGETLLFAYQIGISKLFGVEINSEAVKHTRQNLAGIEGSSIHHGSADALPWPDNSFDVVTCFEVLEHVPMELRPSAIKEMHRVLKPSGRLILTVPYDGCFGFLDPSNFRFRFPAVFEFASRVAGGQGREAGFENQKHGVVWHHHFQLEELKELFERSFRIQKVRWRGGLISPLAEWVLFPFYRRKAFENAFFRTVKRLQLLDTSISWGRFFAYDVLIVADKADVN